MGSLISAGVKATCIIITTKKTDRISAKVAFLRVIIYAATKIIGRS